MRRAFKYRIVPQNAETEQNLIRWLNMCRELYNSALEERINAYKKEGITRSAYDQMRDLKIIKMDRPEFKLIGSQVLKDVLSRLDLAYKAFFRRAKTGAGRQSGFPKFQSFRQFNSFTFPNSSGWSIDGRFLHITHIGRMKLYSTRGFPEITSVSNGVRKANILGMDVSICTLTIKRMPTGKWFAVFSCKDVPTHPLPRADTPRTVGLDVGIAHFLTDSNGERVENPRFLDADQKQLRVLQRKLSRVKRGSKRREVVRIAVARLHEKIVNRRRDFASKLAHFYVSRFDQVAVEKLDIKSMVKRGGDYRNLPRKIHDAAWRDFQFRIESQCEDHEKKFSQPDGKFTTMACSECGAIKPMELNDRIYVCPVCGLVRNRTYNSALNIRDKAFL